MLTLIIGAAASGKSEYAERLVLTKPGERIYLATMEPFGEPGELRIRRHRQLRAGKGFRTVERYTDLAGLQVPEGANVLLECLGNLTANEMFRPDGGGARAALQGVLTLNRRCGSLTVVTDEIGSGGDHYLDDTEAYMRQLGRIQCALAKEADAVIEVVCGLPNVLK